MSRLVAPASIADASSSSDISLLGFSFGFLSSFGSEQALDAKISIFDLSETGSCL